MDSGDLPVACLRNYNPLFRGKECHSLISSDIKNLLFKLLSPTFLLSPSVHIGKVRKQLFLSSPHSISDYFFVVIFHHSSLF